MTATEYAEINRQFQEKFAERIMETSIEPKTCYISGATWAAVKGYIRKAQMCVKTSRDHRVDYWNGLPVVRVMDENYFELR